MVLDYKGNHLEIKSLDTSKREVYFYFSNFDTKDTYDHIVKSGAFKKTAIENIKRVKHFRNHNDWNNFGQVFTIQEDAKGAFAGSKIKRGPEGDQMLIDYEDGIITEHSFGANPVKEYYDADLDAIIKVEYQLWEVSSLDAWGANQNTPLIALKSMNDFSLKLAELEKYLRTSELSGKELKAVQKRINELNEHLKSLPDGQPVETTETKSKPNSSIDIQYLIQNLNK